MVHTITHLEAHRQLQLAADATLTPGDRLALEVHMAGCAECQGYARSLERTQQILRSSMHRRWDREEARFSTEKIKKHTGRTFMFKQTAITAGTLAMIAGLAFAFFTITRPFVPDPVTAGESPSPNETPLIPQPTPTDAVSVPPRNPVVLASDVNGFLSAPVWSPDGTRIAFIYNDAGLGIVNTDGSNLLRSNEAAGAILHWSEDSSRLFFCSGHSKAVAPKAELFSISRDGSDLANITNGKITQALQGSCNIVSSPDGERLAFTKQGSGGGLHVMDLNGENLRELTPPNTGVYDFSWSPDGSQLVFLGQDSFNPSFSSGLYLVRSDGGALAADWTIIPTNAANARWKAVFSPDGQKIAYVEADTVDPAHYAVYTMDSRGVVIGRLVKLAGEISGIAWSPDGTQLSFVAGLSQDIYVMQADGSNLRYYKNPGRLDEYARWSPDGQQLVFVSRSSGGEGQLLLIGLQDLRAYPAP